MKTLRMLCITALLFAGMAQAQEADPAIEQAKAAVVNKLKDPESAHFTDLVNRTDHHVVCGWVNAKNSFGGYVGFRPFVVSNDTATFRDDADAGSLNNRGIFAIMWNLCRPLDAEVFGDAHVDLPTINVEKYCRRLSKLPAGGAISMPDCLRTEAEAQTRLQTHTTASWVAMRCAREARESRAYGLTQTCVREGEADIVFSRGPHAANAGAAQP